MEALCVQTNAIQTLAGRDIEIALIRTTSELDVCGLGRNGDRRDLLSLWTEYADAEGAAATIHVAGAIDSQPIRVATTSKVDDLLSKSRRPVSVQVIREDGHAAGRDTQSVTDCSECAAVCGGDIQGLLIG
jgi:hypothetical protein